MGGGGGGGSTEALLTFALSSISTSSMDEITWILLLLASLLHVARHADLNKASK